MFNHNNNSYEYSLLSPPAKSLKQVTKKPLPLYEIDFFMKYKYCINNYIVS